MCPHASRASCLSCSRVLCVSCVLSYLTCLIPYVPFYLAYLVSYVLSCLRCSLTALALRVSCLKCSHATLAFYPKSSCALLVSLTPGVTCPRYYHACPAAILSRLCFLWFGILAIWGFFPALTMINYYDRQFLLKERYYSSFFILDENLLGNNNLRLPHYINLSIRSR